nr:immunoglobulin heavy chain junction region [Macaca mulatta]MOV49649.1 immunoglobulin heavy chain junction region [Macaca mulatta]MOV50513.1 immunoglobulin heavy chain junction region [Macaca mulatta]MOV51327.1 immunoglobulin heavy chain junction region [Macaca mulatta]MOV51543.1 immunoglobulin heavy chain junction region [Macaca mulatta]
CVRKGWSRRFDVW